MSDEAKKVNRGRTFAPKELEKEVKRAKDDVTDDVSYPLNVVRPQTRGECVNGIRPCPYVSCEHHLYLDVNRETGALKYNFPSLEVWEMRESCVLDVADRGGITLEEVGVAMGLTRERVRQIETRGLAKVKEQAPTAFGCVKCGSELPDDAEFENSEDRLCTKCEDFAYA